MLSGELPPTPPGDQGPSNRRDGEYTGQSFPEWGDFNGNHGKLTILKLEAATGKLPQDPFLIRKSVEAYMGTKITSAYPEKKGLSYVIKLRNRLQIEKLMKLDQLNDGFQVRVSTHPVYNYSKCVISCEESIKYSDDQIKEHLQDQGVVEIRRITRPGEGKDRIATPTVILTIEGTVIPPNVDFGWIRCRTRPYYPSPMLCYGCFEYGHTRAKCSQTEPTCGKCSGIHMITPDIPCSANPYCKHCKTDLHSVSSRQCPAYQKEVEIQHLKVDNGISYPAARRAYNLQHSQQSMAAVVTAENDKRFADINAKLDNVLKELGKKDQQIEALIAANNKKDKEIAEKDRRIAALEAVLATAGQRQDNTPDQNQKKRNKDSSQKTNGDCNINNRLELTRIHGTIEDLVEENRKLRKLIAAQGIAAPAKPQENAKESQSGEQMDTDTQEDNTSYNQNNTGTKPKTKKQLKKKNSDELEVKRAKGSQPPINTLTTTPMYISDTEEGQAALNSTIIGTDGINISADEMEGTDPLNDEL